MNETVGANIRSWLVRQEVSVKAASEIAGVTAKTFGSWLAGRAGADIIGLLELARFLDISLAQLIGAPEDQPVDKRDARYLDVPIFDITVSCGSGRTLLDERPIGHMTFPVSELRALGDPKSMCLMRLSGDSMAPELRDGELVMIDTSVRPTEGLVCARIGDELLLKRLRRTGIDTIALVSVNEESYPPLPVHLRADGFDVIGKAVWSGGRLN